MRTWEACRRIWFPACIVLLAQFSSAHRPNIATTAPYKAGSPAGDQDCQKHGPTASLTVAPEQPKRAANSAGVAMGAGEAPDSGISPADGACLIVNTGAGTSLANSHTNDS